MPRYTFTLSGLECRTVDACDLKNALEQAGISKDEPYELTEENDPYKIFFLASILDETFDS
jgi:hypothetical protein